jgi:hypothetical protein
MVKPGGVLIVDRYRVSPKNVMPLKYLLRPITKRMDSMRLLDLVDRYVRRVFSVQVTLLRRLQGSRRGQLLRLVVNRLTFNSVYPLNLYVQGHLSHDVALTWSILDTFDMYGPRYDSPQTYLAWRHDLHQLEGGAVERCVVCGQGNAGTVRRRS